MSNKLSAKTKTDLNMFPKFNCELQILQKNLASSRGGGGDGVREWETPLQLFKINNNVHYFKMFPQLI